jgi:phospholipase C
MPITVRRALLLMVIAAVFAAAPSPAVGHEVDALVVSDRSHAGAELAAATDVSPIRHVVVIYQENHSFDNVLGVFCVKNHRCDGAMTGKLPSGRMVRLATAGDVVAEVGHNTLDQRVAIDHGRMDGFAKIGGCRPRVGLRCYSQYRPRQIPNLTTLARSYSISDHTFELHWVPSFGAHVELVAARLDGFVGNKPFGPHSAIGLGWGCDSHAQVRWRRSRRALSQLVPACVPERSGAGPYRASPVAWVPTMMDRLDAAGLSWSIYGPPSGARGYGWTICPVFADCIHTQQASNARDDSDVIADAAAGTLPNFSIVIPTAATSQHNSRSMAVGDNWIGRVVGAIMHGPDWATTAIFITYDDCGCFYDHVAPPRRRGIRVPMVIVSPYARAGYSDTTPASFASLLAYTEHTFNLAPLWARDANAYDYRHAFDYMQTPLPPAPLTTTTIPARERRWLRAHPAPDDDLT